MPEAKHPGGRPPLPPEQRKSNRVQVAMTDEQLALIDDVRGEQSRSEWIAERAVDAAQRRARRSA